MKTPNRPDKLLRRYGLTVDQYQALVVFQGNRCAICNREMLAKREPHVDHDHRTGRVRGLLCCACNMRLGPLERNEGWLASAERYLGRSLR